jgi:hypothetical protein
MARHTHIANTEATAGIIHVRDESLEHGPPRLLSCIAFATQTCDHKCRVQHDHFEATMHGVGHTIIAVEGLGARLCHNSLVQALTCTLLRRPSGQRRESRPE